MLARILSSGSTESSDAQYINLYPDMFRSATSIVARLLSFWRSLFVAMWLAVTVINTSFAAAGACGVQSQNLGSVNNGALKVFLTVRSVHFRQGKYGSKALRG